MKEMNKQNYEGIDPSEEYFRKKNNSCENETEDYFPQEESKPPHY